MFFFIPYINKLLHSLNEKEFKKLCFTIIILFSILPFIILLQVDSFIINKGYYHFWLIFLYIIGGYLKYHPFKCQKIKLIFFCFIREIIPWLIQISSHFIAKNFLNIIIMK